MKPYVGATMRAATIAKLLMLKPRTLLEAMDDLKVIRTESTRIKRYIEAYHDQGVVYISAWHIGKWFKDYVPVYAWQPSPFECADAPKPVYVRGQLR